MEPLTLVPLRAIERNNGKPKILMVSLVFAITMLKLRCGTKDPRAQNNPYSTVIRHRKS
jgi:hypothetical protein